jgi:hypothetical protein
MILQSYLAALVLGACVNVAMTEPAGGSLCDDTLQRYLAQSKFCVAGRFISVRSEQRGEQGGAQYLCEVEVLEAIKGELTASSIRISFMRPDAGQNELHCLKAGAKSILFLDGPAKAAPVTAGAIIDSYSLADAEFGILSHTDALEHALKRIAETPQQRNAEPTSAPPPVAAEPVDLEGRWLLTMPREFEYEAQIERVEGEDKFRLTCEAWNLRGIYRLCDGRLTIVQPENERLIGLVWEIKNKNVLLLTEHPESSQVGSDYRNATLSRFEGTSVSKMR